MKHKRKCIEKKSYSTLDKIKKIINQRYIKQQVALNYYECPICLDFHLTKKHSTPHAQYNKRYELFTRFYRKLFPGWKRKDVKKLIKSRTNFMLNELNRRSKPKRKLAKIKTVTLPLSEQRKILATLSPH